MDEKLKASICKAVLCSPETLTQPEIESCEDCNIPWQIEQAFRDAGWIEPQQPEGGLVNYCAACCHPTLDADPTCPFREGAIPTCEDVAKAQLAHMIALGYHLPKDCCIDCDSRVACDEMMVNEGWVKLPSVPIVCLCGSTRFVDTFNEWRKKLTCEGKIVLSIEIVTSQTRDNDPQHCNPELKQRLDELHLRKIDLATEVMVLNVGGYIGESTAREIKYAESLGKQITYLELLGEKP